MEMMFVVEGIRRTTVNEDKKTIDVCFVSGEDQITIRFPVPDLSTTASILREAVERVGAEAMVGQACRVPRRFSCGEVPQQPGFAMMILDQGFESQVGYLMTGLQARTMGQGLMKAGRHAIEAKSRAAEPRVVAVAGEPVAPPVPMFEQHDLASESDLMPEKDDGE